jgi:trimeric autotransporter adhesin
MKTKILILILFSTSVFSQNITNTLGTNGVFSIKDGSSNFFTLSLPTGNVNLLRNLNIGNLLNSTSTSGVITKNGVRFIHNYQVPGTDGYNTFVGLNSGNFTMSGSSIFASYNTGVGYGSLFSLSNGFGNSAFGYQSLYNNTLGYDNTAIGIVSLTSNTTGYENTAVGNGSLSDNTTGYNNTALGSASLYQNITGYENTAAGYQSLYFNNGHYNTAIGSSSLFYNSSGNSNTSTGFESLMSNTTGNDNSVFGAFSMNKNTTGYQNSAFGEYSLYNSVSGFSNASLGTYSLYSCTNGYENSAFGDRAGFIVTTGVNVTCLGYYAIPSSGTVSNQVTLGNNFVTSLRCNVTTITSLSDARDKKNIKDLNLGIDFLMQLKPRLFNWDKREWYDNNISDGTKMQESPTAGFIAQELDSAQTNADAQWLNLVLKDNPDKWEATPGNLLPIVVKAIQDLKEENDKLKLQVDDMKDLNDKMAALESRYFELLKTVEKLNAENSSQINVSENKY